MAYPTVTNSFTSGTTISASQMNTNFSEVINGVSDGTKDIRVNNATFSGDVDANGALFVQGNAYLSSSVQVAANATVVGSITAAAITVSGAVAAQSTLTVTGAATFSSTVEVGSTLRTTGAATFSGAMYVAGSAFMSGSVFANADINANNTANPYVTTAVITGFTGTVTRYISFYGRGKDRKCHFDIQATSGVSNAAGMTLPTSIASTLNNGTLVSPITCQDGSTSIIGCAYISGANVTFFNSPSTTGNNWTSGTAQRWVRGTLHYEVD